MGRLVHTQKHAAPWRKKCAFTVHIVPYSGSYPHYPPDDAATAAAAAAGSSTACPGRATCNGEQMRRHVFI